MRPMLQALLESPRALREKEQHTVAKTYITFGQEHRHVIDGQVFDKDCVAEVNLPEEEARAIFMPKFCFSYTDLSKVKLEYYPRGLVTLDEGAKTDE